MRIAMHWLIRLLEDDTLQYIQVEVVAVPGQTGQVAVDDVVVTFQDEKRIYIQAKKNQPQYREWRLTDAVLKKELLSCRHQLEADVNGSVKFYSRSQFGVLQKIAEESQTIFQSFQCISDSAPKTFTKPLATLAKIFERTVEQTHQLLKRITFGGYHSYEEWDQLNLTALDYKVIQPETALKILESFLGDHHSGLRGSKAKISKDDIIAELEKHRLVLAPKYDETQILTEFYESSLIGRSYLCTIDGEKIDRPEKQEILDQINSGAKSVLVVDRPGAGKTCLLLDLATYIEDDTSWTLLFIKGDLFRKADNQGDLCQRGLPDDIVGKCARLSKTRKIVVIIDSLDVLAIYRNHGALGIFLSLIDRIVNIENVTVVVACRVFDLEHDPYLRDREWGKKVSIGNLDFQTSVAPFLMRWNVDPSSITDELKELLGTPQNLRVYSKIAGVTPPESLHTVFDLYEAYIHEYISNDEKLGKNALSALQAMAAYLLDRRDDRIPIASFSANELIRKRLISQEVLIQAGSSSLSFSHQTLLDTFAVRGTLAAGNDLRDFILSTPQFPFVRPIVRSFFFHLRAHHRVNFARQVSAVLNDTEVAYHIKRLLVESLPEIMPTDEDWRLLRRIFNNHPDLFERFFTQVNDKRWFVLLSEKWFPLIRNGAENEKWRVSFADKLKEWCNDFPEQVIAFWLEAIGTPWSESKQFTSSIAISLHKFKRWDALRVRELLEKLISSSSDFDRDFIGQALSQFVAAVDGNEDLLWQYICGAIDELDLTKWSIGQNIRCRSHELCHESFLSIYLKESPVFLDRVIASLNEWSERNAKYYEFEGVRDVFLDTSSWAKRHVEEDNRRSQEGLTLLIEGVEQAILFHAENNDEWWQKNEVKLLENKEELFRYIIILAYRHYPGDSVSHVENILQDKSWFLDRQLRSELGELIQISYPLISGQVQETNQEMLLGLYSTTEFESELWCHNTVWRFLSRIPAIYRTEKAQEYLDTWNNEFEPISSKSIPQKHGEDFGVHPITEDDLYKLDKRNLIRLFQYYDKTPVKSRWQDSDQFGPRGRLQSLFRRCCAKDPTKYLPLLSQLFGKHLHIGYLTALLSGVSDHLRYRFDNLSPSNNWTPAEPLPDGEELSLKLLDSVESYRNWLEERTIAEYINAAVCSIYDPIVSEQITIVLFSLQKTADPAWDEDDSNDTGNPHRLESISLNSVRGIAASSSIKLLSNLIERECTLPELLKPLIRHFAQDPNMGVRLSILQRLPWVMHKDHTFGWHLFSDIFSEPQTELWKHAERCLYYQYKEHFDLVEPYLQRLHDESLSFSGGAWGRIATLASLSGNISTETLLSVLENDNLDALWKGAAQVYTANINIPKHRDVCEKNLISMLERANISNEVVDVVERSFSDEKNGSCISPELAIVFLRNMSKGPDRLELYHFLQWFSLLADRNPEDGLMVAETLATELEGLDPCPRLWRTKPLKAGLVAILREADEVNDPAFIARAINIQDRLLKLDIHEFESIFDLY